MFASEMSDTSQQIKELVEQNKVVLFMKGTRMFPQCGFSARAVEIFKRCGAEFKDVNVLADPQIRQGIKEFSNWPTIPQAYVDGTFVGGSDILLEMYESGELQKLLGIDDGADDEEVGPPMVSVSATAKEAFQAALKDAGDDVLRFDVSASFNHDLFFGPKADDDFPVDVGGLIVHVPRRAAKRANGVRIDFVNGPDGKGFKIDNPNAPASVQNVSPAQLKCWLGGDVEVHLFDVRPDQERKLASIPQAKALDGDGMAALEELPKSARIVLHCHHGVRSRAAADKLLADGYTNVHNLVGGIDAYAAQVDKSIPRY